MVSMLTVFRRLHAQDDAFNGVAMGDAFANQRSLAVRAGPQHPMLGFIDALGLLSAAAFVACLAAGATVTDFFTLIGGLAGPTNTAPFALLVSSPGSRTPLLRLDLLFSDQIALLGH
jgi:hypothetical protein